MNSSVPYPFFRDTGACPDEMFRNLSRYEPKWDTSPYRSKFFRPAYGKGFLRLVTGKEEYDRMNAISNIFTEEERLSCSVRGFPSPLEQWYSERVQEIVREEKDMKVEHIREVIYSMGLLRECTLYKPTTAAALVRRFGSRDVLDLSAGWGDRLIGTLASGANYTGCDPNPALAPKYEEIISRYKREDQRATVILSKAEDLDLGDREFDLFHSSPPYWTKELYPTMDPEQSLADWRIEFFFPYILKGYTHLCSGGKFAIYIEDTKEIQICGAMHEFLLLHGAIFEGIIGIENITDNRSSIRPLRIYTKP